MSADLTGPKCHPQSTGLHSLYRKSRLCENRSVVFCSTARGGVAIGACIFVIGCGGNTAGDEGGPTGGNGDASAGARGGSAGGGEDAGTGGETSGGIGTGGTTGGVIASGGAQPGGATGGAVGGGGTEAGGGAGRPPSQCVPVFDSTCGSSWLSVCVDCATDGVVTQRCTGGLLSSSDTHPCAPHRCVTEPVPGADTNCLPEELCVAYVSANLEPTAMDCVANPCGPGDIYSTCVGEAVCPEAHLWSVGDDGGGASLSCIDWPPDCPVALPTAGDACPLDTQHCLYQDCADYGVADARCVDGAWTVDSAACADFYCTTGTLTCAAGEICRIRGPIVATRFSCDPAPEEPGLVGQVGFGLTCDYDESAHISGGGITWSCTCLSESPVGC